MNIRNGVGAAVVALGALGALGGCDTIGNPFVVLGSKPPAPDEFQVITRKPLVMPPSAALPEPRLGEASPLDPTPNRDAELALLGTDARPVEAGTSQGEQALLAAADVAASNPEIRQTLALDKVDSNEPYEPPSIFELLGTTEAPPKDAIDAPAEARRLQAEGVAAAPIDPNDRPIVVEGEVVEEVSQYPEIGLDRRPNNRPLSTVDPAFE